MEPMKCMEGQPTPMGRRIVLELHCYDFARSLRSYTEILSSASATPVQSTASPSSIALVPR